jgi:hypothetical protein
MSQIFEALGSNSSSIRSIDFAEKHPRRSVPHRTGRATIGLSRRRGRRVRAVRTAAAGHRQDHHLEGGEEQPPGVDIHERQAARRSDPDREGFEPLECPNCGGDVRLIAFITEPGPIRKILTHLGEPLEPPPGSPARKPPTNWGELVQVHDDRDVFQASPDELPVFDIHSL